MCGISGVISERANGDDAASLVAANAQITHRGPDGHGTVTQGQITLGHRRLSIIDIEQGQQPMASVDGNLWVTFNGEIYNYRELRSELSALGYPFSYPIRYRSLVSGFSAVGSSLREAAARHVRFRDC